MARNFLLKALKITATTLFWIDVWWIAGLIINKPLLFPTPPSVIKRLLDLIITKDFWIKSLSSLGRVGAGISIAIVIGFIMGIICSFSKVIYDFFSPIVTVIKSTPVASFIILIWVFISNNLTPIVISALMVFPIVFTNTYQGMKNVDKNLIEVCKIYKISRKKTISSLYIPSILPYFSSALLSSIGLGWKAGIAAEVLCTPIKSIGIAIFDSKTYIMNVDLFAWTCSVILFSLILEILITQLIKLGFKKYLVPKGEENEN